MLIENGYSVDVLLSCSNQELTKFAAEKLPWISNVLSNLEDQVNKAVTSCFYAMNPVWFTTQELCYHLLTKIAVLPSKKVL